MTNIDAEIDAFWNAPPTKRPKMRGPAPLPTGTITVTITCRVCSLRAAVAIDHPALLCRECMADLPASRRHAESQLAAAHMAGAQRSEAWLALQAALPDDLCERWQSALQGLRTAEKRLHKATTGRSDLATEQAARAEVETIRARFDRAAQNPQNPLSALVHAQRDYQREVARLQEDVRRWEMALQEIDAATDAPPF